MPGQWFDPWNKDNEGNTAPMYLFAKNGTGMPAERVEFRSARVYHVCYDGKHFSVREHAAGMPRANILGLLAYGGQSANDKRKSGHFIPLNNNYRLAAEGADIVNSQQYFSAYEPVILAERANPRTQIIFIAATEPTVNLERILEMRAHAAAPTKKKK